MLEILGYIVGVILIAVMGYGCWVSSVILSERNYLRKLTGGYYDYEIDEVLKELGITREEAIRDKDLWL
jgi:hypothetical protein|tara:strand:- start:591 stop:797 length:207 start_codon:yes stop_codon:yes gene_type:complete